MNAFSARYDAALALAATAHRQQVRKGTSIPYIAHAVHVSVIIVKHGYDEDMAVAALLHDVVEDTDISLDAIRAQFGDRVAALVAAVSEQKTADGVAQPWAERKAAKLHALRAGGPDVAALKAADAIHNARSIIADLQTHGPAVWQRFRGSPQQMLGYYRDILAVVETQHPHASIAAELRETVDELARLVD